MWGIAKALVYPKQKSRLLKRVRVILNCLLTVAKLMPLSMHCIYTAGISCSAARYAILMNPDMFLILATPKTGLLFRSLWVLVCSDMVKLPEGCTMIPTRSVRAMYTGNGSRTTLQTIIQKRFGSAQVALVLVFANGY